MRVLVCGGRNFHDRIAVFGWLQACHLTHKIECVIHGDASGADYLAGRWAETEKVPVRAFPADWDQHGKAAGPMRNQQMVDDGKPDLVIAFPGGRGTADMRRRATAAGIKVIEAVGSEP